MATLQLFLLISAKMYSSAFKHRNAPLQTQLQAGPQDVERRIALPVRIKKLIFSENCKTETKLKEIEIKLLQKKITWKLRTRLARWAASKLKDIVSERNPRIMIMMMMMEG